MHRILKQTVELSIAQQADAVAVQDSISRVCQNGGLLELERVFDRLAGDRVVRVDRLELDLGEIGGNEWMAEFLQRLAACAEHTLTQAAAGPAPGSRSSADGERTGFVESLSKRSQAQARLETLAAFLRRGRLPWWSDSVIDDAWVRDECAALTAAGRRGLLNVAARYPRALQRLVIYLQAREIERLLRDDLPAGLAGRLAMAIEQFEEYLVLPPLRISEWRAAYWRPFFRFVQQGQAELQPETVVRHWFASSEQLSPGAVEKLRGRLDATAAGLPLPREWRQAIAMLLHRAADDRRQSSRRKQRTPPVTDSNQSPAVRSPEAPGSAYRSAPAKSSIAGGTVRPLADDALPSETPGSMDRAPTKPPIAGGTARPLADESYSLNEPDDAETEGLYVTGAGMVLLHPFLGELFKHLELVEKGQFVDEDARQVAVQVLGYLAFGSEDQVEADLTLAKLLCGLPLDEVLLPVSLSAAALAGADELLAAVLKHWTALKSSSAQWLREQFILRAGKLEKVDAGWRLVIESKAQDVLLAKLPWGVGVISLPWLGSMLYVSW